ncbi:hypothetical protein [Erwinia tasmaniensis]|uniref:Uncharacterized protein n=1 Tax=Erwinia tasmaniensis (strain DSM 17950 / CFBP 7177 / CIP 109463 / NCPPB 4357 / Et1/99) TaxID=465817 RepID=B2VIK2_ERWT9|nr:hypothetical protein [Erwinia tasmaniensis]CAO96289.1 hypothetical protein ETA_12430 [Erwinia tasmaniensis Et1/99]
MAIISASNLKDAEELLYSGINKVALAYDINGDDFFRLACHWCQRGATISKESQYFIVSLKGFTIPPND